MYQTFGLMEIFNVVIFTEESCRPNGTRCGGGKEVWSNEWYQWYLSNGMDACLCWYPKTGVDGIQKSSIETNPNNVTTGSIEYEVQH